MCDERLCTQFRAIANYVYWEIHTICPESSKPERPTATTLEWQPLEPRPHYRHDGSANIGAVVLRLGMCVNSQWRKRHHRIKWLPQIVHEWISLRAHTSAHGCVSDENKRANMREHEHYYVCSFLFYDYHFILLTFYLKLKTSTLLHLSEMNGQYDRLTQEHQPIDPKANDGKSSFSIAVWL